MRRTENPENEVQVLKAPHDMVIVALHSPPRYRSGGEAVNAPVCKTGMRRFESGSELKK